ncbi:MAG: hypothetical protein ACOZAA_07795, partial [Pseudomonadota bacterium]
RTRRRDWDSDLGGDEWRGRFGLPDNWGGTMGGSRGGVRPPRPPRIPRSGGGFRTGGGFGGGFRTGGGSRGGGFKTGGGF